MAQLGERSAIAIPIRHAEHIGKIREYPGLRLVNILTISLVESDKPVFAILIVPNNMVATKSRYLLVARSGNSGSYLIVHHTSFARLPMSGLTV